MKESQSIFLTNWRFNKSFLQAQLLILITCQSGNTWNAISLLGKTPGKMKNSWKFRRKIKLGAFFSKLFINYFLVALTLTRNYLALLGMYLQLYSAGGLY